MLSVVALPLSAVFATLRNRRDRHPIEVRIGGETAEGEVTKRTWHNPKETYVREVDVELERRDSATECSGVAECRIDQRGLKPTSTN